VTANCDNPNSLLCYRLDPPTDKAAKALGLGNPPAMLIRRM